MRRLILLLALSLATALPAAAQVHGGSISGTVKDTQGGVLPGATVTAQGIDATQSINTTSDGAYHFPRSGARILQDYDRPQRFQNAHPRQRGGGGRQDGRRALLAADCDGEGRDHRGRGVAHRERDAGWNRHDLLERRVEQHPDLARSVRDHPRRAGRADRSRERVWQRDRPAVARARQRAHGSRTRRGRSTASRSPTWAPRGSPRCTSTSTTSTRFTSARPATTSVSAPAA